MGQSLVLITAIFIVCLYVESLLIWLLLSLFNRQCCGTWALVPHVLWLKMWCVFTHEQRKPALKLNCNTFRGATALLVAVATPRCLAVAQANYCNSFQLTHMPRGNRAQSIASNGGRKEDKTLLQHLRLSQHGELWHASVSERQRSRPCGQNLREVPENGTATGSQRALEQWRPTARQKRSYLSHQGEFQHQLLSFRSVLDSDHGGVVRIYVGQS